MLIAVDDLSGEETRALLALHLAAMRAGSPPGQSFALDLSGLQSPDITVWTLMADGRIAGVVALKDLGNGSGELKSMRTHPDFLRRGVAAALLDHTIAEARTRGYRRLSLETGSGPEFEAAIALYLGRGFLKGEPFADYQPSDFNAFYHLSL